MVGDKVYTLKTSSDKDKMELGKLAGKMAKVTGDVTGDNADGQVSDDGHGEEVVAIKNSRSSVRRCQWPDVPPDGGASGR